MKTYSDFSYAKGRNASVAALTLICTLITVSAVISAFAQSKQAHAPSPSAEGFERLKKLNGKWRAKSTKGWEGTTSFKTIAAGSVVVEDAADAHPNETMMNMYVLDGDRLMFTHYCVSRTEPRLVATAFADEGKTITFTFLDGTNVPTRDHGHMDKLVLRFVDDNHITKQWTWYQDGKESWMEEIQLERVP